MMCLPTKQDLTALLNVQPGPLVSLYMPTARTAPETKQNPIRFKNLLAETHQKLVEAGLRPVDADDFLQPLRNAFADPGTWDQQSDGLAVFYAPNMLRQFRVPRDLPELVAVGERFHIKPLLPLVTHGEMFYILALSQNETRLLHCTRSNADQIHLADLPDNLQDALWYLSREKSLQYHAGSAGSAGPVQGGQPDMLFHGQGTGVDDQQEKKVLVEFLRAVDQGLQQLLKEKQVPLILACVGYLQPLFRSVTDYPYLMDEIIEGNPETLSIAQLHAQGWTIVEPYFHQQREQAIARYQDLLGSARTTDQLQQILKAAHFSRVDTLFVADGVKCWGTLTVKTATVEVEEFGAERPNAEDLLNVATIQTIKHGGDVFLVPSKTMPSDASSAAILRY